MICSEASAWRRVPDVVDAATRSRMMSGIRGKDTGPERCLRSALHRLGFRFRLNRRDVPGRPDLVLPRYRAAVFVHGCFWHGHNCPLFRPPKTRPQFWADKVARNRARDAEVLAAVVESGWRHLAIWECSFRGGGRQAMERTARTAAGWIRGSRRTGEIRRGSGAH
jgi:DNA mismatch endonuclease (patch repair protein)